MLLYHVIQDYSLLVAHIAIRRVQITAMLHATMLRVQVATLLPTS